MCLCAYQNAYRLRPFRTICGTDLTEHHRNPAWSPQRPATLHEIVDCGRSFLSVVSLVTDTLAKSAHRGRRQQCRRLKARDTL